jgi:AcrR family transcriptional regulator
MDGTKEKILTASLPLFALKGYDATGVQEVSDAAAVSKPTLYYYFGNKQGLFRALWECHAAPFFRNFTSACIYEPHPSVYEQDVFPQLCTIAKIWLDFTAADPLFVRMMLSLEFAPLLSEAFSLTKDIFERRTGILVRFFTAVSRSHGNMKGKESQLAKSFLALADSLAADLLHTTDGRNFNTALLVSAMVKQFMHGIFSL